MIIIFTVTNLCLIAGGGVVFTLGLTGYWAHQEMFSYIMVRWETQAVEMVLTLPLSLRLAPAALCVGALSPPPWMFWRYWESFRRRNE